MINPALLLSTGLRERLINRPAVTDLVPAEHIRTGPTRPDKTPAIIIADGTTPIHGHDYTAQRAAWVYSDLHVWAIEDGNDLTKAIAFEVQQALDGKFPVPFEGAYFDHFKVTRITYPRDPDPNFGHAVISVEALIRWIV